MLVLTSDTVKKPVCELCGTLRALRSTYLLDRIPCAKLAKDRKARGVGVVSKESVMPLRDAQKV